MNKTPQTFGGDWTSDKLERVSKYLDAYKQALKNQPFYLIYIDAFAGTGYRTPKKQQENQGLLLPEFEGQEAKGFVDGSARIALQGEPPFDKYIFIEQSPKRFIELQKLKEEFPTRNIELEQSDANAYIMKLCKKPWIKERAVLFLDPFGMQVTWDTIGAIAKTKAIDLWLLFPLGVAVNRLLKKDANIPESWRKILDEMFGTTDWYEAFYKTEQVRNLFEDQIITNKMSDFDSIGQYFVNRLKTVFAGVAKKPLPLTNSRNVPLYLLCFASGNPKGAPIALRIAENILRR
jgi:three-Cys-motif partner protein